MNAPTLTTERLILRALTMVDWESYAAMWADPRVTTFIGAEPRPLDVAWPKFGQAVAMWGLLGYGNWAVIDRADATFLGVAGFSDFKRGLPDMDVWPEAGWAFAVESWGRGIASEAVGSATGWADAAGFAETRCMINHDNVASVRVAERCGYVPFVQLSDDLWAFRRPARNSG